MLSVLNVVVSIGLLAATAHSQTSQLECPSELANYTACAGTDVTFTCVNSTQDVKWDIYDNTGKLVATYASFPTINTTVPSNDNRFSFDTDGSNSTLTFEAQYDLNEYTVSCTDVVFTTNSTTNKTTTMNTTESCSITVPEPPSGVDARIQSIQGNSVTVEWTNSTEVRDCILMYYVWAVPENASLSTVMKEVEPSATTTTLTLIQNVPYTIDVTTMTINENVTSNSFCIILSSPGTVSNLEGNYRVQTDDIYVSWKAPKNADCQRPNVTTYNVTHNATDDSSSGDGSGAPMAAMNETFTLLSNVTDYTFKDIITGNVYFVEVIPSNTFGFGSSSVVFITATSPTSPPSTPTTPVSSTTPTSGPGGLSAGAIAGIVIAIVVVVVLAVVIVGIVAFLTCRGSDNTSNKKDKPYKDDGTRL